jgi:hypothetical protein
MTERILGPTGSPRRRRWLAVPILLVACTAMFWVAGAQAVHDIGLFELDANTLNTATPGDDWSNLYGTNGTNGATTVGSAFDGFTFVPDGLGTTGDVTYWTGGGSKDRNDISQWLWGANDQAPDKNDLENAFAAAYHKDGDCDANSQTPDATCHYLYFGADRFTVNGDAQMGFWFLVNPVCLEGTTTNGVTCPTNNISGNQFLDPFTGAVAHHSDGDVLALVNFNNGGTIGAAAIYTWAGGTGGAPVLELIGTGIDCQTLSNPPGTSDKFCTTSNKADLLTEPVWPYTSKKSGKTINYYQTSAFMEGGINLSAIAGAGTCFPSFIAETRSSSGPSTGLSLDAQLKDLAFGSFQTCRPSTSLAASGGGTFVTGTSVTLTFNETNDGNETLLNPNVIVNNGCSAAYDSGDTDTDGKLDPGETWVFKCTVSASTGSTTYSAYGVGTGEDSGILVTGVLPCTNSATVACSSAERASATVVGLSPSTQLTKTASAVITYTFAENNNGDAPLTNVSVSDANCDSAPALQSGDTSNTGVLDPGETWIYTCTHTLAGPSGDTGTASVTNTATATGQDASGRTITACADPSSPPANTICKNEKDSVKVEITNNARSGG